MVFPFLFPLAGFLAARAIKHLYGARELPPHVERSANGKAIPSPGYDWVTDAPGNFAVRWVPGKAWPEKHLLAGDAEGQWGPAPGYVWVNPKDPDSMEVRWRPGRILPGMNLLASEREGGWKPAPGYSWTHPTVQGSLQVHWTPGKVHCEFPHVYAADRERTWVPETGYRWGSANPSEEDLRVVPEGSRNQSGENRWQRAASRAEPDLQRLKDLAALGLDEDADAAAIDAAYRRLAKVHHPDRFASMQGGDREAAQQAFLRLGAAYDRLKQSCRL